MFTGDVSESEEICDKKVFCEKSKYFVPNVFSLMLF